MSKVTREMIAAAHDVTMRHKIVLGHELLTEIYQAMDAKKKFVGLTDEMDRQAAQIEDYSQRNLFITGWLHAEAAHGIKGDA